jgi:hypothetical protein
MALNSCPTVAQRACHTQDDLYNTILLHNSEPLLWFSDPDGIKGALGDPALKPCGTWVLSSDNNKAVVLGNVLNLMHNWKYLTPVVIGTGEHWVNVFGYETDVEPPGSGAVTLQRICFYDPLPGMSSTVCASGETWLGTLPGATDYWAAPLSMPGSTWNGMYVAVIEPPAANLVVRIPPARRERLRSPDAVLRSVSQWLVDVRKRQLTRGMFGLLARDLEIKMPVLVRAERPYYLVRFGDGRLAAIFSISGVFEEVRLFREPLQTLAPAGAVMERVQASLRERSLRVVGSVKPELVYRPGMGGVGRFLPEWEIPVTVSDASGRRSQTMLLMEAGSDLLRGLEKLPVEHP